MSIFNQTIPNEGTAELYALLNELFTPESATRYRYLSAITEYASMHKSLMSAVASKNPSINTASHINELYAPLRQHAEKYFFKPSTLSVKRKTVKTLGDLGIFDISPDDLLHEARQNITSFEKNIFVDAYFDRANPPPALKTDATKAAFKEYFNKIMRLNDLSEGRHWGHSFRRYAADPATLTEERIAQMQAVLDIMDKEGAEIAQQHLPQQPAASEKEKKAKKPAAPKTAKITKLTDEPRKMLSSVSLGMATSTLASGAYRQMDNQNADLSSSSFLKLGDHTKSGFDLTYKKSTIGSRESFGRFLSENKQRSVIRSGLAGASDNNRVLAATVSSYKFSGFISGANWVSGGWGNTFSGEEIRKTAEKK